MNAKSDGETDVGREAVADLEHGFDGAKNLVKRARILLAGDVAAPDEAPVTSAGQATLAPSSDTVQNPAAE